MSQWPPVAPKMAVAVTMRGPTILPSSIACRRPTSFQRIGADIANGGEAGLERALACGTASIGQKRSLNCRPV